MPVQYNSIVKRNSFLIVIFIVFICLAQISLSQTLSIDSLKKWSDPKNTNRIKYELNGYMNESLRARKLRALGIIYSEANADSALKYGQLFYLLCKKNKWLVDEAWAQDFMGAMYLKTGNSSKALELCLEALKKYETMKDSTFRAINYKNLGDALVSQKDAGGIRYYLKSLQSARTDVLGSFYKSWTMIALGNYYLNNNNLDSAIYYAQQSYQIQQSLIKSNFRNLKYYADCLNLMGRIQQKSGNISLALEYYRLAVKQALATDNLHSVSTNYMDIASLYKENKVKDSSLKYANDAFAIAREINSPYLIFDISTFLKEHYKNINRLDSAFKYQEIMLSAKDSLLSVEKIRHVQNLAFDEQIRQQEIALTELKDEEERKHNLQYAVIVIGLITFIILFLLLSRSIIVKTKFIEFFGVLGLLAVFEFINLFIHPYLAHATNDSPVLMLVILIVIGALLIPLHHKLEKWITKIMVEKNKKMRLEAAKKTIQQLEGI